MPVAMRQADRWGAHDGSVETGSSVRWRSCSSGSQFHGPCRRHHGTATVRYGSSALLSSGRCAHGRRSYRAHLAGLVVSNMTASVAEYVKYAAVLVGELPPAAQAVIARHRAKADYEAPEYQQVLMEEVYSRHVCRLNPWPEPLQRCFRMMNAKIYNTMQGPDEFNIIGSFKEWDIWARLHEIAVPTLLIAARYDEMSPAQIQRMGTLIPHARVALCERGSHMAMYDDQRAYFDALIPFLREAYGRGRT